MAFNRAMSAKGNEPVSPTGRPHVADHRHADVTGGWLRAATFGAMDGLVTNTALVAGVGGGGAAPLARACPAVGS